MLRPFDEAICLTENDPAFESGNLSFVSLEVVAQHYLEEYASHDELVVKLERYSALSALLVGFLC